MKRILFIVLGLWGMLMSVLPQNITLNGGIPNHYLKVDEVLTSGVRVTQTMSGELGFFMPGDKVLLIQMTGVTLVSTGNFLTTWSKTKESVNDAGKFEVLQVDEVNTSGSDTLVTFTDNVANAFTDGEKIQLVKLVEAENITVTGIVNARKWDGKVGGIVALIAMDSLKLHGSIDVSGQGFRGGAVPAEIYTRGCRYGLSNDIVDTLYFRSYELNRSGNKGEGVINVSWPYTKGTAFNVNGGGAGNGLFSGGGGGSNYGAGGDGGQQSFSCDLSYPVLGGWGGYSLLELYGDPTKPKIIMGGGGGSGTKSSSSLTSKGGDGGGMIILITGTLTSNSSSNAILANGESASSAAGYGSGGGGGAAGTILIDATTVISPFTIRIKGGNGGSTSATPCNGAGGSGSGGVFWHSGTTFPAMTIDTTTSTPGFTNNPSVCVDQGGIAGFRGVKLKRLIMPLNGFLFNTVKGRDTICEGQVPRGLTASMPKGGNGSYAFTWQQSFDKVSWVTATGGTNITLRTFNPPALSQTTHYRRVVTSDVITDISMSVTVFVYPAISNNTITGTDTLCYNVDAKPLMGIPTPLAGGNGIYSYQWQQRTDLNVWSNISTATGSQFDPAKLTSTTHYRRNVYSTKYCSNTSDSVTVTVLPLITNNAFSSITDTAICMNTSPGLLNTLMPGGGDGTYDYLWQRKNTTGNWLNIASSNVPELTVGLLTDTTSYRRIVFSGNDNACKDTIDEGVTKTVLVMPLISNNNITGSQVRYTCYNGPILLTGSQPQNGFGAGTYAYAWEQSDDNITWEAAAATTRDYQTPDLTSAQYFRRIVYSTPALKECADISDAVEVKLNTLPAGNVINTFDTLCAGETLQVNFNVTGNGPFTVSIQGDDLPAQSKAGVVGPLDSIAFVPLGTQDFTIVTIEDDSSCFADSDGFIALTPAAVYVVPVANAGVDDDVCSDTYTLLAQKFISASEGLWTASDASFSDITNENSNVTVTAYGPRVFTWTETNWHCTDADEVEITFYEQPQPPDAGPDQVLDFTFTTQLEAAPVTVGQGKWTVTKGYGEFNDDALPNAVISELASGTSLKWTITNGSCEAISDSLEILIEPLVIDQGFTPNGDGKHDEFIINAGNAEQITLKVYNSAGALVFESKVYRIGEDGEGDVWNGYNMNDVELPEGTYFYIADIRVAGKAKEVQFRSFVEILR